MHSAAVLSRRRGDVVGDEDDGDNDVDVECRSSTVDRRRPPSPVNFARSKGQPDKEEER